MPIVPSRASRVHDLVRRLASPRPSERDSAVAQLTLLGPRVIEPLLASLPGAPVPARLAALEVMERIDDPRGRAALSTLVGDESPRVALRAIEVMGDEGDARVVPALARILSEGRARRKEAAARALARLHGAGVVEALEPLVDLVLDEATAAEIRLWTLDEILAIRPALPRSVLRPLGRRLRESGVPALAARGEHLARDPGAGRDGTKPASDPLERLARGQATPAEIQALLEDLPGDTALVRDRLHESLESARDPGTIQALGRALGTVGSAASIPVLARALARTGTRVALEGQEESALAARAALHLALARLDSRVALHDLRELLVLRPSGVVSQALEAAAVIGDASLVPALARVASEDPSLTGPCAAAYAAIARRHRIRRTSTALRKVRPEHRAALDAFLPPPRARRR